LYSKTIPERKNPIAEDWFKYSTSNATRYWLCLVLPVILRYSLPWNNIKAIHKENRAPRKQSLKTLENDKVLSVCTCSCPDVGLWYGARNVINYNFTDTYNRPVQAWRRCALLDPELGLWGEEGNERHGHFPRQENGCSWNAILILFIIMIPKCPRHSKFSCIFQMNYFRFL